MSALGLPIFDKAMQDANIWVNDVMDALDWDDKQRAYNLLRSTLHVLRDQLHHNESAHFAAQLPTFIRGIYYEGYRPANQIAMLRRKEQFAEQIMEIFTEDPYENSEKLVSAVLEIIAEHVSEGEIEDIKRCLPEDVRTLWP